MLNLEQNCKVCLASLPRLPAFTAQSLFLTHCCPVSTFDSFVICCCCLPAACCDKHNCVGLAGIFPEHSEILVSRMFHESMREGGEGDYR
jgi:hypothetical protein